MILFHPRILGDLPTKLLLNLHRQVCKIRSNPWKKPTNHSWYYNLSYSAMVWYHTQVMDEMIFRGFKPAPIWRDKLYRGRKLQRITPFAEMSEPAMFAEHQQAFDLVFPYNLGEGHKIELEYIEKWKRKHPNSPTNFLK